MFFKLRILIRHPVELASEAAHLVLLLETALQSALSVLEQPSLLLGQIGCGDPLFDRAQLPGGRILRSVAALGSIGEIRNAVEVFFLVHQIGSREFLFG